jgi:hypothetical protein
MNPQPPRGAGKADRVWRNIQAWRVRRTPVAKHYTKAYVEKKPVLLYRFTLFTAQVEKTPALLHQGCESLLRR